jgi:FkbM family methyltransferase
VEFRRETDRKEVQIPCFDWEGVAGLANHAFVDLLHIDAQGAEWPFLTSLPESGCNKLLRFAVVSTHHASISGSATTHRDCLLELVRRGAVILCEHAVEESFSGDGLIVASFFPEDAARLLLQIERNMPERSLFGRDLAPKPVAEMPNLSAGQTPASTLRAEEPVQVETDLGPMWVMPSDSAIGASLLATGRFEESMIAEVASFLSERYAFVPEKFVDVGANIGSHLLYSQRSGLFKTGVAFEADPVNYDLLVRNIRLAGLENQVKAFHFPISDRAGAVTIERAPDNLGDHRVRVANSSSSDFYQESFRETLSLVSETLDNLDAEFQLGVGAGTLCWIDTQGHEGHVLAGAKGLIERGTLQYLVCEFWPYGLERSGGKEKFFDFLSRCCAIYDLRQPDWQNAEPLCCDVFVYKYEELLRGGVGHTDLLCIV